MQVLDERGFLFGRVNVVDAFVVLGLLTAGLAGATLAFGSDGTTATQTVSVRTDPVPGYVERAVTEGSVPSSEVVAVRDETVSGNGPYVLGLQVELAVVPTSDGLPTFRDERLYVGRTVRLDLGSTIVEGVVVDMEPVSGA